MSICNSNPFRSVLITGAGTGLGLETALYLAGRGFLVYATIGLDSQRRLVEEAAKERQVALRILPLDVTSRESIRTAVSTIVNQDGGMGAVVNNAGVSLRGYFEDCEEDEVRRVLEVNLFGAMNVTREILPYMRAARSGRLLFISSVGGRIASLARTSYCASKFALEGFAEALYQELGPLGIDVSILEPAIIKTERWTTNRGVARNALRPGSPYLRWFQREEELADRLVESSPTRPEDVAQTVFRILSAKHPRLRYVVGSRAKLAIWLRQKLPARLFERFFFGPAVGWVTKDPAGTD